MPVCASEEEKAPNSSEVVLPSTSGDGAYEESFPDCPQLMVCCLTILLVNERRFLGGGEKKEKKKKKEKKQEKKQNRLFKAAKMTLSEI